MAFSLEKKLVKTDIIIDFKTESKGKNVEEASGSFHLLFIFSVENLGELAIPQKNEVLDLNPALANALSSITYSTARGILLTRLQGTAFQDFILPIVHPDKLLKSAK